MKAKSENQSSSEAAANSAAASAFASQDDLVRFASNYFAADFPNPGRLDCPPSDALNAFLRSGKSPDDQLRGHLFGCSECFKEYRTALSAQRSVASASPVSWWSRVKAALAQHRTPAFAGAFSVLLLFSIGAYVWQEYRRTSEPLVGRNDAAPANVSPETPPRDISTSVIPETPTVSEARAKQPTLSESPTPINRPTIAQRPPSINPVPRDLIAINTVKADLEDYSSLRGGTEVVNGAAKAIKVSRPRTRLLLTLPEGSIGGLYQVSIVDNSGNALTTVIARSANGKTIIPTLDLQRLPVQKYRLRISREGEVPSYYPIVIEDQKPTSRGMRP